MNSSSNNVDGDRIVKDADGNISEHLQNHIHLTNCIHLKNHMHLHNKQIPGGDKSSLLRDLASLEKSRQRLRDPSEIARSRHSPCLIHDDFILQRRDRDDAFAIATGRLIQNRSGLSADDPPISRPTSSLDDRTRTRTYKNRSFDITNHVVSERLSCNRGGGRQGRVAKKCEEDEAATNTNKEKRRRFRSARRNRPQMPPATNSLFLQRNDDDQNGSSKCGIPWNWSRIHHRGKPFLDDVAGRQSLSRGLSESRLQKEGDRPITCTSENSSSSLPLLLDAASESQGSIDQLSIFAEKQQHQNLTQKYMPRTFSDLVGQNLVVQALSNAVMKRKIGLLYVFYGPHGTGKTACARIFARALYCQSLESTGTSKPCGFCDSCIANDKGKKSRNVREIGPVHNIDYEGVLQLFENHNGVFIFDECDAMPSDCWTALLKVIYGAPTRVVIILVCSNLASLPHVIVSRCQKFCFTKLKDADIVYALQLIARKEDLDIDRDALKLIASRSDGSLRDAEMTLEQLSLLGQKVSLCLVQQLIGLISNEKLLDLLDFALSADTINTVKNVRDIMASGVEPLALMSQLATMITDILAGSSYDNAAKLQRPKRNFFHHQALSKEDMEKLRQALKTLSEAEKQLRLSSERMTWLTAALLQLAPDKGYAAAPPWSADTCSSSDHSHSPVFVHSAALNLRVRSRKGNGEMHRGIEEIWLEVLENVKIKSLKEFMHKEGKMAAISYGAAPTVQLVFDSQLTKSVVEKFRSRILEAFEAVLGSPVTIEIRQGSREETGAGTILLRGLESDGFDHDEASKCNNAAGKTTFDERESSETNQSRLGIVRRRQSLAHVIQHHDGSSHALSIADKLEQQNLKLEPRSRRLLCWNPPRITHRKLSSLKIRRRKPQTIRKFVCCGRSFSVKSSK